MNHGGTGLTFWLLLFLELLWELIFMVGATTNYFSWSFWWPIAGLLGALLAE